jgi:transcriptional regulator with GAF, ATPase, and Fis domain
MDWLGMAERPLTTLLPQVRRDGLVRKIPSWIKVAHAPVARVEISAALLTEGDQECIGFTIHRVEVLRDLDRSPYELNLAIQQLTAQVGKLALPALMRQVAEMAERHFVHTAMLQAANDAAGAATALGISHDDLLQRMQRLGERDL